jgi:hypothetical protein
MGEQLQQKRTTNEAGVLNFDTSENAGTLWTCYWERGNEKYVSDSFGGVPHKSLFNYLDGKNLNYDEERMQHFDTVVCGQVCLAVLKML